MCDPPVFDEAAATGADVSEAADAIKAKLHEDRMRLIFDAPYPIEGEDGVDELGSSASYIQQRGALVGVLDSSELLARDEEAGLWPEHLPKGDPATAKDMLWVDELSCIGCTWCADVARSTFRMESDAHGTARVIQQGGDSPEVVEEAIDCCPADCIYTCTRKELELLEEHRSLGHIEDLLARFHSGARLTGEGDGGGGGAVPHWKDAVRDQSWRKGDKYVKSRRLEMADPLLRKEGWKAVGKENTNPSPQNQDGTVIGDEQAEYPEQ